MVLSSNIKSIMMINHILFDRYHSCCLIIKDINHIFNTILIIYLISFLLFTGIAHCFYICYFQRKEKHA